MPEKTCSVCGNTIKNEEDLYQCQCCGDIVCCDCWDVDLDVCIMCREPQFGIEVEY